MDTRQLNDNPETFGFGFAQIGPINDNLWARGSVFGQSSAVASVWDVLFPCVPVCLWAYNGPMQIVNYREHSYNQIGASGDCPHCGTQSYFHPVATHIEQTGPSHGQTGVSAAKCQSCKNFVLVIGLRSGAGQPFVLDAVYPLGKPKDDVDANVPPSIAADFSEALRCHWIRAHKGCVVMCRRAVQASALKLGAPKNKKLDAQIDWLHEQGKITESLKDFAHEVRLTANIGAHPDKNSGQQADEEDSETDNLEDVTPKDAEDIVEFTREYFHHVYVMPAKLKARRKPSTQEGTN